jgi:predicted small secreted protein
MMKHLFAAVLAASFCVPPAAAESLLQRSDWQGRRFETYLPRVNISVQRLELHINTKLPKRAIPLGREVASLGPWVSPYGADIQASTNAVSNSSM